MDRKKFLIWGCIILFLVGLFGLMIPFVSSLKPNARADAALPRLDFSNIKNGTYEIFPHPVYGELYKGYSWSVLVYRSTSGKFTLWDIPTRNGAVGMPDIQWWRPIYDCKNFGPAVINGLVDESKLIKCHDSELFNKWWSKQWKWDITGKSLGEYASDMPKTRGVFEGKYFVFQKNS